MSNRRNHRNKHSNDASRNPVERINAIGRRIRNRAAGYQEALRKHLAELYEIASEIEQDFEHYKELIAHECFFDRKRIREAKEDNFTHYVTEAVIRRAFDGSDVSESCISKYIGAMRHCGAKGVRPTGAAAQIEEWGGVEATYQRGKDPTKKKTSSPAAGGAVPKPKASGKDQTIAARTKIFDLDHLHITLERKALRNLLKAQDGERRQICIECKGRDQAGYLIWKLVEENRQHRRRPENDDNDWDDIEDVA